MMGKVCWLWGQKFFLSFCFKISYNIECFYSLYIKGTRNEDLFLKYPHFNNLQNLNIGILLILFFFSNWGLLYSPRNVLSCLWKILFFPFKLLHSNINAYTFLLIFFISKIVIWALGHKLDFNMFTFSTTLFVYSKQRSYSYNVRKSFSYEVYDRWTPAERLLFLKCYTE